MYGQKDDYKNQKIYCPVCKELLVYDSSDEQFHYYVCKRDGGRYRAKKSNSSAKYNREDFLAAVREKLVEKKRKPMYSYQNNSNQSRLENENLYCTTCYAGLTLVTSDESHFHYVCSCGNRYRVPKKREETFCEYRQSLYDAIENLKKGRGASEVLHSREFRDSDLQYYLYETALCTDYFTKDSDEFDVRSEMIEQSIGNPSAMPLSSIGRELLEKYRQFKRKKAERLRKQKERRAKRRKAALIVSLVLAIVFIALVGVSFIPGTADSVWVKDGVTVSAKSSLFNKLLTSGAVELSVKELEETDPAWSVANRAVGSEFNAFTLLDLDLIRGKDKYSSYEELTVTVEYPENYRKNNVVVYHVTDDGVKNEVPYTVSASGYSVTFTTEHFSMYAIGERPFKVTMETGGVFDFPEQKVLWGDLVTAPTLEERTGYVFDGWFAGDEKWDFNTDTVTHDLTLKARWTAKGYTIILNAEGGEYSGNQAVGVTYGSAYSLGAPTRYGYRFLGWFDGDEKKEQSGVWTTDANLNLVAKWGLIEYTILYDGNGATEGSVSDPDGTVRSVKKEVALAENAFLREGYKFVGWNTEKDGSGKFFTDKSKVGYVDAVGDGDEVRLYAQWENNKYNIVFSSNVPNCALTSVYKGEISGSMGRLENCVYDQNISLPSSSYSVDGWKFAGWAVSPEGEAVYSAAESVVNLTTDNNADVYLYAVWEVDPYLVGKYVTNGSVVSDTNGKNTYTVYNDIGKTPKVKDIKKVIIDWSNYEIGEYDYIAEINSSGSRYGGGSNDLDIINADEIYIIGKKDVVYTNVYIYLTDYVDGKEVALHFDGLNMEGVLKARNHPKNMKITLDILNSVEITAPTDSPAISEFKDLYIVGDGTLVLNGGNGSNGETGSSGKDGQAGISVESLTVEMSGVLSITGGDGGTGGIGVDYDTCWNDYGLECDGRNGGNGGTGGQGGSAIVASSLTLGENPLLTLSLASGNGGDGGRGGDGEYAGMYKNPTAQAGRGGNGGSGGSGGQVLSVAGDFVFEQICSLSIAVGSGGTGGSGGDGGHADEHWVIFRIYWSDPGDGGTGGSGGTYGSVGSEELELVADLIVDGAVGANGSSGSRGAQTCHNNQ